MNHKTMTERRKTGIPVRVVGVVVANHSGSACSKCVLEMPRQAGGDIE